MSQLEQKSPVPHVAGRETEAQSTEILLSTPALKVAEGTQQRLACAVCPPGMPWPQGHYDPREAFSYLFTYFAAKGTQSGLCGYGEPTVTNQVLS